MRTGLCQFALLVVCAAVGVAADAPAQPATPPLHVKVANGSCRVTLVAAADPKRAREFEVRVNTIVVTRVTLEAGKTDVTAVLNAPLTGTDEISVQHGGQVFPTTERLSAPGSGDTGCAAPVVEPASDARDGFSASFYVGAAVDNFAPSRLGNYVEDPTLPNKTRWIAGVDFEYRLLGSDSGDVQLWLLGETLHGVRPADVDCAQPHAPSICCSSNTQGNVWRVLGNEHCNIAPYSDLKLCWIYNHDAAKWRQTITGISGQLWPAEAEPGERKPQLTKLQKQFQRFPWFSTFEENKPYVIKLSAAQVNVLADLAEWSITNDTSAARMTALFGDALAAEKRR